MSVKEATARIKINDLLKTAEWRFFADGALPANIQLEPSITIKSKDLDALGEDFEKSSKGFIDFLLLNEKGFPFIVLEAKSEDKSPLVGKEQARKYARSQNCRFVILSNGNLHYFWDLERGNPYVITTFPTPTSVMGYQKTIPDPKRLVDEIVTDDYIVLTQRPNYASEAAWKNETERTGFIDSNSLRFLRPYQMKAMYALQRAVKEGKDRFLFEMATGTGKTLTSAAVIKLFLRTGNARRVLFLVDRLELEDQAKKAFGKVLANDYQTVIYKENRDDWQRAEIVVTTVQSLLFNNKYQHLFSPTDFYLVISDEAHRSIGGNARAVFDYFIGYKLGLTATPRDYLKKFEKGKSTSKDPREFERRLLLDTYRTFGCDDGQPTYRYSLLDGVKDGFLINPTVVDARSEVTTQLLSDDGFVVEFKDDQGEDQKESFKQREFEKRFFADATNQLFCKTFLEHAYRDPISGEIGKSIIFAVSQNHAGKIVQILKLMADKMFPGKYQSDFAVQVTSQITDAQQFTINFTERLGDAFEYLLSVLGSQGDAGQFRTPRHIIDFMVEVLAPKKGEVILDPACGTAGFLISAWKHILRTNTDTKGHSTLTPDEKGRLATNFKGYDISPDMVRLSLVNLYLHGFTDPHIYEYDTLTSEDRWNEFADVILANPPFMSPKGGIKPHKRFSIQAKRSEVLFVDYMAEHLTPTGRAGIIVPEGIIFQSQTAYKELRKMLVENSLVAVVSLPAGVFNPYSGVKTSILILDKSLAKQTDTIAFFKVENDGFGLGAQRRANDGEQLTQVQAELTEYLKVVRSGEAIDDLQLSLGLVVAKEKIAAIGDYGLSGERYRESDQRSSQYPHVDLGEVVDILDSLRRPITKGDRLPGPYPYYGATGILDYVEGYLFDEELVLVGEDGAKWGAGENCAFPVEGKVWVNNHAHVLRPKRDLLLDRFLIEILNEADLMPFITGVTVPKLNQEKLRSIQIPLPPLEVQKEIVAEIEGYQRVINGARAVLDNYRPHIPIHTDWPMVRLAEVCQAILTGPFGSSLHQSDYVDLGIPVINPQNIVDGVVSKNNIKMVSSETRVRLKDFGVRENDVIIGRRGEMGRCAVVSSDMNDWLCGTGCFVIRLNTQCDVRFAFFQISSPKVKAFLEEQAVGVTMMNLNQGILSDIEIPLSPLATQQAIVAEIEAEQALVNANRELIERFEKKIQATLARDWGEEEQVKGDHPYHPPAPSLKTGGGAQPL